MKAFEEIVKEYFSNTFAYEYYAGELVMPFDEAIKAAELYASQFKREWVSCEGNLPGEKQIVLAYGNQIYFAQYERGQFYRFVDACSQDRVMAVYYNNITHWQPLPQPPEK